MLEMLAPYFPERPVDPACCDPEVTREDFFADSPTAAEEELQIYDRFDLTIATSPVEAEAIRIGTRNTRVLDIPVTFTAAPASNRYDGSPVFHIADDLFSQRNNRDADLASVSVRKLAVQILADRIKLGMCLLRRNVWLQPAKHPEKIYRVT